MLNKRKIIYIIRKYLGIYQFPSLWKSGKKRNKKKIGNQYSRIENVAVFACMHSTTGLEAEEPDHKKDDLSALDQIIVWCKKAALLNKL
jgi:hypothetical protein